MQYHVKINNLSELKTAVDLCHKHGIDWRGIRPFIPPELGTQSVALTINHCNKIITYTSTKSIIENYNDIITLQEFISYMNINSSTEHVLSDSLFEVDKPNLRLDK